MEDVFITAIEQNNKPFMLCRLQYSRRPRRTLIYVGAISSDPDRNLGLTKNKRSEIHDAAY